MQDITEQRLAGSGVRARAHKQLLVASRYAGMAEVANNVLHNVGNVLNSVNVSASLVADRIKKSKSTGLTRLAALLNERASDLVSFVTSGTRGALAGLPHRAGQRTGQGTRFGHGRARWAA